jgi:hypothetical protein
MSTNVHNELEAFRHFIDQQLEGGCVDLTPEESLDLWRSQQRERVEANEGIHRALEDLAAGRGQPLSEFAADFREKNNIPQDS